VAKTKYRTLAEYLTDNFYDLLAESASGYIAQHKLDFKTNYIPFTTEEPELDSCTITSLYTEALKDDYVYIHCAVSVSVIITGYAYGKRKGDIDQDTALLWLSMKLKARFIDQFQDMEVVDVRLLEDRESFRIQAASTKNFVPYIQEKDLEYHATQILKKYYPKALEVPMALPLAKLVKAMGVKVLTGHLKGGVFGKCYFIDKNAKDKDGKPVTIKRGTIVCDNNAFFYYGVGSLNNTIVHECVHWELHRKFFALLHLLNSSLSNITCTVLGEDIKTIDDSLMEEYKWMEWQANALAPRILMPADMTKLKFEQIKAEVISSGETSLVKVYEQTINRLATFFDVTITSVKIRLLELGYDYLKGIHDYIDNSHTKSYLYNASKIKPEQSFSASFYDAVANGTINKQLRDCLEKRTIVYASGFFVINNKKYTYKDKETGKQELTDYALEHMDECCLVFNHERKNHNSFNDRYYSMCFLARSRGKEFNSNVNSADEHNSAILESASQLADLSDEIFEIQEANNLVRNMNGSFAESLAFLMKENGFSNNSLYSESYINDHKIAQFLSGEKEPSKGEVLAICAAMHLHPIVTHKLLEVAGKRLNLSTEMDGAYDFLIREYYDQGLDAWNAQLNAIEKVEWTLP